jgi:aspartyl protease family protein
MLRKFLILGVFAGSSASIPILYQSNPGAFEALLRSAVNGKQSDPASQASFDLTSVENQPVASQPSGRKVVVTADARGHFLTTARLNGRQVDALIDTGATLVAINLSTARKAGISVQPSDFSHPVATANGSIKAALARINHLQIGKIALDDVQAVVLEDRALQTNLIGMSFLQRLGKYQVENGTLLLVQ